MPKMSAAILDTYRARLTRVVTKERITKTAESACCEEECFPLDWVSGSDFLRLQLALKPSLLGFDLSGDLISTLPDVGTLTCDRIIAGSHNKRVDKFQQVMLQWILTR